MFFPIRTLTKFVLMPDYLCGIIVCFSSLPSHIACNTYLEKLCHMLVLLNSGCISGCKDKL